MLILPGAPALSAFRLDKLQAGLSAVHPGIQLNRTSFIHFADTLAELAAGDREVLDALLRYGPEADGESQPIAGEVLVLVVPRPGTIPPGPARPRISLTTVASPE